MDETSDDDLIYAAIERVPCAQFVSRFVGCTEGQDACRCYAIAKAMLLLVAERTIDTALAESDEEECR